MNQLHFWMLSLGVVLLSYRCLSKCCNLSFLQILCSYSNLLEVAISFPQGERNLSSWNVSVPGVM